MQKRWEKLIFSNSIDCHQEMRIKSIGFPVKFRGNIIYSGVGIFFFWGDGKVWWQTLLQWTNREWLYLNPKKSLPGEY